jgi:DNA-binding CsgD family transcriptional regulator
MRPAREKGRRRMPAGRRQSLSEAGEVSSVIGLAYDAALDPALWPPAIEAACKFLDCFQGAVGSFDLLRPEADLLIPWGYEERYWNMFRATYGRNPIAAAVVRTNRGDVVSMARWPGEFDYEAYYASDHFREFSEPQGQLDSIQATLSKSASGLSALACIRHESGGLIGETEFRRMRLIAPHFQRAVLIGKVVDLKRIEAAAMVDTIAGLAAGVFLVNALGGLVHANPSGEAMLTAKDPVKLVKGALAVVDPRAERALVEGLKAAGDGDAAAAPGGAAVPLVGKGGDRFVAHVLPLTGGGRREAGMSIAATAALFVRKATINTPAAIAAATRLYGFTPAEERVLRALIELGGVGPTAAMLGVAQRTVRTHLERLFHKTGTSRQAELVKLIAGYASPVHLPGKRLTA